jgi:hypothetical protein
MTQDEIIETARQAGGSDVGGPGWTTWVGTQSTEFLERFAKLVAAKAFQNGYEKGIAAFNDAVLIEREACAAILDANAMACESPIMRSLLQSNAQAIRVRGQA